jgi:hypothetical protein
MARILLATLTLASAGLLTACTFDFPIAGKDGIVFGCTGDEDCVGGFLCSIEEGNAVGACVRETVGGGGACLDRDGDGFFAGDCPNIAAERLDCDDNNRTVFPGATEICNGVDDNCNGTIDEGIAPRTCPLQLGVCAGAVAQCVNGTFQDCAADGLYGPSYEFDEVSCDGLDNDCDGSVDPNPPCACDPSDGIAEECGTDTGACTRGIRLCNVDFSLTPCVEARAGRVCAGDGSPCSSNASCTDGTPCVLELCESNDDCGTGGYCVTEGVRAVEDPFDDCQPDSPTTGGNVTCSRRVCRYLEDDLPCTDEEECGEGEFCVLGFCQRPNVVPTTEVCNGIDDSCNGLIDNDSQRRAVCGAGGCPFNTVLVNLSGSPSQPFICVDRYEASRPDATDSFTGEVELYTVPRAGVLPWTGINAEQAGEVCSGQRLRTAVGTTSSPVPIKQLCLSRWYVQACGGMTGTADERMYPYAPMGDDFVAGACADGSLGLDAPTATGGSPECCFAPNRGPLFADQPTCDMVGNVAEWVRTEGVPRLAGGSFRSEADPLALSCGALAAAPENIDDADYVGFRCCTLPQ